MIGSIPFFVCPIKSIPESINSLLVMTYIPGEDILLEKILDLNSTEQKKVSEYIDGIYIRCLSSFDYGYRKSISMQFQSKESDIEYVIYSSGYVRINGDTYIPISNHVDVIYSCLNGLIS